MGNLQEAALRSLHCHPELSHQVHTPEHASQMNSFFL